MTVDSADAPLIDPEIVAKATDATLSDLLKKPRRTSTFTVALPADDGGVRHVRLKFQALDSTAYDELVAAHPPKRSDRDKGAMWNPDTFPAALVAAVSVVPKMTPAEAKELMEHPDWAAGETMNLFSEAVGVCNRGLDVPFNAGD
jgi:hypothetical protein